MQQSNRKKSGQGVVEYGFCIAFVSVLIAMAFHFTQSGLFTGVSGSYSVVSGNLHKLNTASTSVPQ